MQTVLIHDLRYAFLSIFFVALNLGFSSSLAEDSSPLAKVYGSELLPETAVEDRDPSIRHQLFLIKNFIVEEFLKREGIYPTANEVRRIEEKAGIRSEERQKKSMQYLQQKLAESELSKEEWIAQKQKELAETQQAIDKLLAVDSVKKRKIVTRYLETLKNPQIREKPTPWKEIPDYVLESMQDGFERNCIPPAKSVNDAVSIESVEIDENGNEVRYLNHSVDSSEWKEDKSCPALREHLKLAREHPQAFIQQEYQRQLISWEKHNARIQNQRDPASILARHFHNELQPLRFKVNGLERQIALADELYAKQQSRKEFHAERLAELQSGDDKSQKFNKGVSVLLMKHFRFHRAVHNLYGGRIAEDGLPVHALLSYYQSLLQTKQLQVFNQELREAFNAYLDELEDKKQEIEKKCANQPNEDRVRGCSTKAEIGFKSMDRFIKRLQ